MDKEYYNQYINCDEMKKNCIDLCNIENTGNCEIKCDNKSECKDGPFIIPDQSCADYFKNEKNKYKFKYEPKPNDLKTKKNKLIYIIF